jgi:hypothetical protein
MISGQRSMTEKRLPQSIATDQRPYRASDGTAVGAEFALVQY